MNPIQEAINALSGQSLVDAIALGAQTIIVICMVYVGITQGKRLLSMVDEPGGEHPGDFVDDDGQIWEDGEPTGNYAAEADHQAVYSAAGDAYEPGEDGYSAEEAREMIQGHIYAGDLQTAAELCDECGLERSEFEGWNWG